MRLVLLAAAVTAALSAPVRAAPQCSAHDRMLALLESEYREVPVAVGLNNSGGLVEVLTTGDGATWSIIVTTPQGMSCLVAAGEGWRAVEPESAGPDA